jgi:hypothetical protein
MLEAKKKKSEGKRLLRNRGRGRMILKQMLKKWSVSLMCIGPCGVVINEEEEPTR